MLWGLCLLCQVAPRVLAAPDGLKEFELLHSQAVRRIGPYTDIGDKSILAMKQDRLGFMWVATIFELYRYDGATFVNYTPQFGLPEDEQEQLVMHLFEDSRGNLWVGCKKDLYRYDRDRDRLVLMEGVGSAAWIGEDAMGRLYVASKLGALKVFSYAEGRLDASDSIGLERFGEGGERVAGLLFGDSGQGFVVGLFGKIYRAKFEEKMIRVEEEAAFALDLDRGFKCEAMLWDGDGLWIGTEGEGLFQVDLAKGEVSHFARGEEGRFGMAVGRRVSFLRKDLQGRLWVGFTDGGLSLYFPDQRRFRGMSFVKGHLSEEGRTSPLSAELDDSGDLWLGTAELGIFIAGTQPGLFRYERLVGNGDFSYSMVRDYLETRDGYKLLSIKELGLCRKRGYRNLEVGLFPSPENPSENVDSDCMVEDDEGMVWVASRKGVYRIDPSRGGAERLDLAAIEKDRVEVLMALGSELWLGMRNKIIRVDRSTKEWIGEIALTAGQVTKLVEGPNGRVWIGCRDGLHIYDRKAERLLESAWSPNADRTIILDRWTTDVAFLENGQAWVASYGYGMRLLDPNLKVALQLSSKNGLPSEAIGAFEIDQQGTLWMATRLGIVAFDPLSFSFEHFVVEDGLVDARFEARHSSQGGDGALVFPSKKGLLRIYPESRLADPAPLEARLTGITILDRPVAIGGKGDPLQRSITVADSLVLRHDQSVLTLWFSGMNYPKLGRTWFKHRILGSDVSDWSTPSLSRSLTIANLSTGDYTFELMASSSPDVWHGPTRSLSIIVLPSVWTRWWMILALLVFLAAVVYVATVLRTRSLNRRRMLLERLVVERTRTIDERNAEILAKNSELEKHRNHLEIMVEERTRDLREAKERAEESDRLKSSFLANMSHEIRTPLNAIVGLSHVLTNEELREENSIPRFAEIIEDNAFRLTRLIEDILDVSRLEAGQMQLSLSRFDLALLCREVYREFRSKISRGDSSVAFRLEVAASDEVWVESDRVRVRQILENFLDNAMKFTKSGEIVLRLGSEGTRAVASVKDTGIGIARADQKSVFDRFRKLDSDQMELYRGAGLGLSICQKLAVLLNGSIELDSEEGQGSTFSLSIPMAKDGALIA